MAADRIRHVHRRDLEVPGDRAVDIEIQPGHAAAQGMANIARTGQVAQHAVDLVGRCQPFGRGIGIDLDFQRRGNQRPLAELARDDLGAGQVGLLVVVEKLDELLIAGQTVGADHQPCEVGRTRRFLQVVVERRATRAHEAVERLDAWVGRQHIVDLARRSRRARLVHPVRQHDVDYHDVLVGLGKEGFAQKRLQRHRQHERPDAGQHQRARPSQGDPGQPLSQRVEPITALAGLRLEKAMGNQRRDRDREQIARRQRHDDGDRQGAHKVGGIALGKQHRHEGGDRGPGSREQRPGERANRRGRGLLGALTGIEAVLNLLGHHDGVIHEHAERHHQADHCDLMQHAAAHGIDRQRGERDQRQQCRHHQPHAPAHEAHQHRHHRGDRAQQIEREVVQAILGERRLIEDFADSKRGDTFAHFGRRCPQPLAQFDLVLATRGHHLDADRAPAVVPELVARRRFGHERHIGNRGQRQCLPRDHANRRFADLFDALKIHLRIEIDGGIAQAQRATALDLVAFVDIAGNAGQRQRIAIDHRILDGDRDLAPRVAVERGRGHAIHVEQRLAQGSGALGELHGRGIAGHRQHHQARIDDAVVDARLQYAVRKIALGVVQRHPQPIPHLGGVVDIAAQLDRKDADILLGDRAQRIDLVDLIDLRFCRLEHQPLDALGAGAGKRDDHDRAAIGKGGVLLAIHRIEADRARDHQHPDKRCDQARVRENAIGPVSHRQAPGYGPGPRGCRGLPPPRGRRR